MLSDPTITDAVPPPDAAPEALFDAAEALEEVGEGVRRFPAYPEYKATGIDWLGKVPSHWRIFRAKWSVLDCRNGIWGAEPDGENEIACIRVADFDRQTLRVDASSPTMRSVSASERRRRLLSAGDLLLEKSGGGDLQPVGAVMVFDHDIPAVCSNFVARMPVAEGYDTWYLAYLHHHLYTGRVNARSIKQSIGIQNLDARQYLDERVVHPPLDEQRAIAAFLRRETAKIDALVAKKRRLIELLREKRTALISHAVTKGLNPDAPMKPSGIDWLGDVPKHWEIPPLYARYIVQLGKMLDEKKITKTHLVPYLRNVDVQWDRINVDDLPEMDIEERQYDRFTVRRGDLLVCEGGEVGRCAFWNDDLRRCGFQKAIHRLRPRNRAQDNPRFLFYVMYAAAHGEVFVSGGNPNTIPHLTAEKLRVYRFAFPPREEQDAIVASLDRDSDRLTRLVGHVEAAVSRLAEYRSALISAAVTGKLDLREAAADEVG